VYDKLMGCMDMHCMHMQGVGMHNNITSNNYFFWRPANAEKTVIFLISDSEWFSTICSGIFTHTEGETGYI
jgi:hypothetical protein